MWWQWLSSPEYIICVNQYCSDQLIPSQLVPSQFLKVAEAC